MEEVSLATAATIVIMFVAIANLLGRVCLVRKQPISKLKSANEPNYSLMSDEDA